VTSSGGTTPASGGAGAAIPWVAVVGVGVWMPGVPDARAFREGVRRPDAEVPPARLPARLRRHTSLLIRMVAEVAAQAAEQADLSLGAIPVVVGSAYGELGTTMEMLHELATEGLISPFRFHNSVHNTASAYLSIAHENRSLATSVAAGNDTAAMILLDAMTLLAERGGDVLVVIADEPLPEAMIDAEPSAMTTPISAAAILRARPTERAALGALERTALAWLGDLRQGAATPATAERSVDEESPSAAFLRLVASVMDARSTRRGQPPSRVDVTAGQPPRWSVAVAPSIEAAP
jgi:beta-ketoacyl synthase-like protein